MIHDPDGYHDLAARFELWNVHDPAQRREIEADVTAPSTPCRIVIDATPPATADDTASATLTVDRQFDNKIEVWIKD